MTAGSRRGRPMLCPPPVLVRVLLLHGEGLSDSQIGAILNREGITTPAGRRWQRCHVWRLRRTAAAVRLLEAA